MSSQPAAWDVRRLQPPEAKSLDSKNIGESPGEQENKRWPREMDSQGEGCDWLGERGEDEEEEMPAGVDVKGSRLWHEEQLRWTSTR